MVFYWDEEKRKYRDESGNIVPDSDIHEWLDDLMASIALLFIDWSQKYYAQEIDFDKFFNEVQDDLRSLHYAAAAIAFGGFGEMSNDDARQVEAFIYDQLSWYRIFMTQVYNEAISEKQTNARLLLYALAGYSTYSAAVTMRETAAGMLIYRRILQPGDNCEDCIEFAFRRWRLIGQLPAIGSSQCRTNCRCHFVYSNDLSLLK
jgi:hypothetical protein